MESTLLAYTDLISTNMKIINNYNDITIGILQDTRLYIQGHPLVSLWRKKRKNIKYQEPIWAELIKKELTSDFIAIDCAGWYFANDNIDCQCIELWEKSKNLWHNTIFEYDYLTWHPTYLEPVTVLAYYSSYFKYSNLEDMFTFFNEWLLYHPKIIIGLDPTKIKFNYLKYDFVELLLKNLQFKVKVKILQKSNFNLLLVLEKL